MPNDAKFGLVAGVCVVIAVAVVFFRKDGEPSLPHSTEATATAAVPPIASDAAAPRQPAKPTKTGQPRPDALEAKVTGFRHVVQEGETLFSLAERYYGDRSQSERIFTANRGVLETAEQVPVGTDLLIPQ